MDQQQLQSLYERWKVEEAAGNVAAMVALANEIPEAVDCFPEVANCTGFRMCREARSLVALSEGVTWIERSHRVAVFGSRYWVKSGVNSAWGNNLLGDYNAACHYAREVIDEAATVRPISPMSVYNASLQESYALYQSRRFDEAAAAAEFAAAETREASENYAVAKLYWCQAVARGGRPASALSSVSLIEKSVPSQFKYGVDAVRGMCLILLGDDTAGIEHLERATMSFRPEYCSGHQWRMMSELYDMIKDAYTRLGDSRRAQHAACMSAHWDADLPKLVAK